MFGSAVSADYFSEESDIDIAAWGIPISQYLSAVLAVNEFHDDFKVDLLDPTLCCLALQQYSGHFWGREIDEEAIHPLGC